MAIEAILDNLEGVAEPMKALYVQGEGGKFYLDINKETLIGHPSTAPLSNALQKNKDEIASLKSYAKNFEGIPLEHVPKFKEMLEKMADDEKAALIKSGNFDEYANNKVQPWKEKASNLETENKELRQKLDEHALTDFFRKNLEGQTLDTAFQDVYFRLKSLFKVAGDKIAPADETQTQGAIEYLKSQVKDLEKSAPHLFKKSAGPSLQNDLRTPPSLDTMSLSPHARINKGRGVK